VLAFTHMGPTGYRFPHGKIGAFLILTKNCPDLITAAVTSRSREHIFGDMQKTSDILWQDTQHQVLFVLLDQIAEDGSAAGVLHQLTYYAENHFAIEEEYMTRLNYPGLDEHVQAHNRFREELAQMLLDTEQHDAISRQVISTFLREWLTRHIFGIDKQLEAFILQADIK